MQDGYLMHAAHLSDETVAVTKSLLDGFVSLFCYFSCVKSLGTVDMPKFDDFVLRLATLSNDQAPSLRYELIFSLVHFSI